MSDLDPATLRAHLRALPAETLRRLLQDAVAPPPPQDPPAPDGSAVIRVPGPNGAALAYRLSADDLRL